MWPSSAWSGEATGTCGDRASAEARGVRMEAIVRQRLSLPGSGLSDLWANDISLIISGARLTMMYLLSLGSVALLTAVPASTPALRARLPIATLRPDVVPADKEEEATPPWAVRKRMRRRRDAKTLIELTSDLENLEKEQLYLSLIHI